MSIIIYSIILQRRIMRKLANGGHSFTVTAVLQDFPHNSSLQYDAIFPVDYYAQQFTANGGNHGWKTIDEDINDYSFRTFLLLSQNANTSNIETKLTHLFNATANGQAPTVFQLQHLGGLHLTGIDGNNSTLQTVRIIALVAILILIIASINYVNLSTARALTRIREVSIKKSLAQKRSQLFLQFITETVLTFGFAIFFAIFLILLLTPLYDRITGGHLTLSLSDFSLLQNIVFHNFRNNTYFKHLSCNIIIIFQSFRRST